MTLSEQREAARQFANKWNGKGREDEDARSYWFEILQKIFGDTYVRTDKTTDAFINSLPVCNLSENLSAARSNRDALVNEVTYFLANAEWLSDDDWVELSELAAKASAASSTSEIVEAMTLLQQAYDRLRNN